MPSNVFDYEKHKKVCQGDGNVYNETGEVIYVNFKKNSTQIIKNPFTKDSDYQDKNIKSNFDNITLHSTCGGGLYQKKKKYKDHFDLNVNQGQPQISEYNLGSFGPTGNNIEEPLEKSAPNFMILDGENGKPDHKENNFPARKYIKNNFESNTSNAPVQNAENVYLTGKKEEKCLVIKMPRIADHYFIANYSPLCPTGKLRQRMTILNEKGKEEITYMDVLHVVRGNAKAEFLSSGMTQLIVQARLKGISEYSESILPYEYDLGFDLNPNQRRDDNENRESFIAKKYGTKSSDAIGGVYFEQIGAGEAPHLNHTLNLVHFGLEIITYDEAQLRQFYNYIDYQTPDTSIQRQYLHRTVNFTLNGCPFKRKPGQNYLSLLVSLEMQIKMFSKAWGATYLDAIPRCFPRNDTIVLWEKSITARSNANYHIQTGLVPMNWPPFLYNSGPLVTHFANEPNQMRLRLELYGIWHYQDEIEQNGSPFQYLRSNILL